MCMLRFVIALISGLRFSHSFKFFFCYLKEVPAINPLLANYFQVLLLKFKKSTSSFVLYFFISSASVIESFPVAVTEVELEAGVLVSDDSAFMVGKKMC